MSDSESEPEQLDSRVSCLYNIIDLQRVCQKHNLKFSEETNKYLLYHTLKQLGPVLSQKLVTKLVERGEIEWQDDQNFEVEAVKDHIREENGVDFYLIKWKGWNSDYNSWEPKENLQGSELIDEYHKHQEEIKSGDLKRKRENGPCDGVQTKKQKLDDLFEKISNSKSAISPLKLWRLSQTPTKSKDVERLKNLITHRKPLTKPRIINISNKRSKTYKQLKVEVHKALKEWEDKLNKVNTDPAPIFVENNMDLEGPPANFIYINDYIAGEGVIIPQDPIVGCECENCFESKKECCAACSGAEFAYYKHGKVRVLPGLPIYECNKRCLCGPTCPNRVVQHGRKVKLCIFRTPNGCGWGVKTLQRVKKGSFVMEYVGEVITNEAAERRGQTYDRAGMTYLFDLDYNDGDCPFTVDAKVYGNASHFVNHSCDPNLAVYGVWINTLDPRLPRIALFATRDIQKGEELTFDYLMTGDTTKIRAKTANVTEEEEGPPEGEATEASSEGSSAEKDSNKPAVPSEEGSEGAPGDAENTEGPAEGATNGVEGSQEGVTNVVEGSQEGATNGVEGSQGGSEPEPEPASEADASSEVDQQEDAPPNQFNSRGQIFSADDYRIMCQCGAKKCRKYLF